MTNNNQANAQIVATDMRNSGFAARAIAGKVRIGLTSRTISSREVVVALWMAGHDYYDVEDIARIDDSSVYLMI